MKKFLSKLITYYNKFFKYISENQKELAVKMLPVQVIMRFVSNKMKKL